LLEKLGIGDVQVVGVGGKTQIGPVLKTLRTTEPSFENVTSLGIIRDADDNDKDAFKSVQGALKAANLPCPKKPLVPAGISPKVSVMILPPGALRGALEDMCLASAEDDTAMSCVDDYFACLAAKGIEADKKDVSKAKAQVFLASRKELSSSVGIAARKGYWPFQANAFDAVKTFLQSM
jgi:hypothetical protein